MSPRKPAGQNWESFVDRQIREAQERGDFDDLGGKGKPIPDLDRPHDESWWIRRKLREEKFTRLPPALQLRKEYEEARQRIADADSETEVREIVAVVNERIRYANRTIVFGPPSTVMPLDEDETVRRWRERRAAD